MNLEIEEILNKDESDEKCFELFKLVKKLEDQQFDEILEIYYQFAISLFNNEYYEDCIKYFYKCYKNNYRKNEIKNIIFESFITPNEEEFKEAYKNNSDDYNVKFNINYEELKLNFIPVSENRYYIFDLENDTFNNVIDFNEESIKNIEKYTNNDKFSDIFLIDDYNLENLKPYLSEDKNRNIYYYPKSLIKAVSFLKLPNIIDKYLYKVIIFKNYAHITEYFADNKYLPHIIINNLEENEKNKIEEIIKNEHENRIKEKNTCRENILLSICISSRNNGEIALRNMKNMLKKCMYDEEIEFVFINNSSNEKNIEYKEIENIKDSRLKYFELEEYNSELRGIAESLRIASGRFGIIIRDIDLINFSELPRYFELINEKPQLGFILSGTYSVYNSLKEEYFKAGESAFYNYFLNCNNITGMMYNIEKLKKYDIIDNLIQHEKNSFAIAYPHMWINSLMNLKEDAYSCPNVLSIEGKYVKEENLEEKDIEKKLNYSSYKNRIAQLNGLIEYLNILPFDSKLTMLRAYCSVCWKTHFLTSLVKDTYKKSGYSMDEIYDEIYEACISGIYKLDMEITPWAKEQFETSIKSDNNKFREN